MPMNPTQLRGLIEDVLHVIGLHSEAAVELLMLTAAQESRLGTYLHQLGRGPARGIFQMEPATEADHLAWLGTKPALRDKIMRLRGDLPAGLDALTCNLAYACAMARIHYYRVPAPLPAVGEVAAMGAYWKQFYNTPLGKGRAAEAVDSYFLFAGGKRNCA